MTNEEVVNNCCTFLERMTEYPKDKIPKPVVLQTFIELVIEPMKKAEPKAGE